MARGDDLVAALVRERWRALVGFGYVLCGSLSAAEDLAQEALVRAVLRGRDGVELHAAEAYVRRAMVTLYLDEGRRVTRWRRVQHLFVVEDDGDRHGADPGPGLGHTAIAEALAHLSPRERACVVLRHMDDLSIAETAELLGVSTGAVKKYVSTALDRLREHLGPLGSLDTDVTPVERTAQ